MSPLFGVFSILATLIVTNANPLIHSPRGRDLHTYVDVRDDLGYSITSFAPNWPTCGNDHTLTDIGLKTTVTVDVRADCDTVIDQICKAAAKEATDPAYSRFIYPIKATQGACEGHILFSQVTLADPLDYATCQRNFQSITETCMLIDPSVKNYASVGFQFGVQNIKFSPPDLGPSLPHWTASTRWNLMPGYMMGPVGVFGDVNGRDASDFL